MSFRGIFECVVNSVRPNCSLMLFERFERLSISFSFIWCSASFFSRREEEKNTKIYRSNFIILPITVLKDWINCVREWVSWWMYCSIALIVSIRLYRFYDSMLYQRLCQYYVIHMIIFLLRFVYFNAAAAAVMLLPMKKQKKGRRHKHSERQRKRQDWIQNLSII